MRCIIPFVALVLAAGCGQTESKNNVANAATNGGTSNNSATSNNAATNSTATNSGTTPVCDDLSALVTAARSGCTADLDCEVRAGMCGCPLAIVAASDQTTIDGLLENCDFSETCSLIDCAQDGPAVCIDGTCQIGAD